MIHEFVVYELNYLECLWMDVPLGTHEFVCKNPCILHEHTKRKVRVHKYVQRSVCVRMYRACVRVGRSLGESRANCVSRSLVLVTHWSVGKGDTHYLTPLPGLASFRAGTPIGLPSTSLPSQRTLRTRKVSRLKAEELWVWTWGRVEPTTKGQTWAKQMAPAISCPLPHHSRAQRKLWGRGFLGGKGGQHLCPHLPTSVIPKKVRNKGRRETEKDRDPKDKRQRLREAPGSGRQGDKLTQ